MLRQLRSRLTYANVVSTIALVAAIGGGTAYAATRIGTDNIRYRAVTSPKLALNAVTSGKVRNNSLTGADIRAKSLTSREVKDGSLQALDFAPGQLPKGDKGDPATSLFGAVTAAGALTAQKGVTGITGTDAGAYTITLAQPVNTCAVVATLAGPEAGSVAAQPAPGNASAVLVQTRGATDLGVRRAFQFAVFC